MARLSTDGGPTEARADRPAVPRAVRAVLAVIPVQTVGLALLVGADGAPGWQVARVVAVLGLGALVGVAVARRARGSGVALTGYGLVGLVVGLGIGVRHALVLGLGWRSVVGLVVLVAGLALTGAGWRRTTRALPRRGRWLLALPALLAVLLVLRVTVPAVMVANVPRPQLSGATLTDRAVDHREVEFVAADGTRLSGWYVPSRNRAAVVLRHGSGSTRTSVVDHAVVLARWGFGVLLTDARGHGRSDGRGMQFGWYGDSDIRGAVDFLAAQPDVDVSRIAVVGMSMGGEEAIGAAAADPRIAAVVAEGATVRTSADDAFLVEAFGWRGHVEQALDWLQFGLADLLTGAPRPTPLADAVRRAQPRPFLVIAAGDVPDEGLAAEHLRAVAPDRVTVWEVPGAGHTRGLATAPQDWAQRVGAFLSTALALPACADDDLGLDPANQQLGPVVLCGEATGSWSEVVATARVVPLFGGDLQSAYNRLGTAAQPLGRGYESPIPPEVAALITVTDRGSGRLIVDLPPDIYDVNNLSTSTANQALTVQLFGTGFSDPAVEVVTITVAGSTEKFCGFGERDESCATMTRDEFFSRP